MDSILKTEGIANVIKLKGSTFKQDENRRGAVGVGGIRTLEFEFIGIGEGDLKLFHERSWDLEAYLAQGDDLNNYVQKIIRVAGEEE